MTPDERQALEALIVKRMAELQAEHGTPESCGWHEGLEYQYDMEVAAAFNELKRLAAVLGRLTREEQATELQDARGRGET